FYMKNAIMVTGGAGYVGSHIVRRLLEDGRRVVVIDNLSTGHQEVISLFSNVYGPDQFCFEKVDLLCEEDINKAFRKHEIIGIIDFAAKILVPESQDKPRLYFDNNVLAFLNLITLSSSIPIVKSSTAAAYGEPKEKDIPLVETYQKACIANGVFPDSQLMPAKVDFKTLLDWYRDGVTPKGKVFDLSSEDEALLKIPNNVYGITKMMDEIILAKSSEFDNRQYISLRYFNAAGADQSRLMGEDHSPESHLIPIVLQVALGKRSHITIYGDDYNTRDGTTVRDYVSVQDLAEAHILCLDYLLKGGKSQTFNLGTGNGFSVQEILESARKVTGKGIPAVIGERRSGDPAKLIADTTSIHKVLGWKAKKSLEEIIMSAWNWHRLNPEGYRVTQEERFNPFWNRWVNIAAHRRSRPWFGQTEGMDEASNDKYKSDCHLCPGNKRAKGDINPLYDRVWTFKNDFPTLAMDTYKISSEDGPYKARTSLGICEVVNYSPDHSLRMSIMEMDEITNVIDEWANIYKRLGEIQEIKYPLIFE
ncbi:galactose-1-phosphate uridylyltransferase, partial [Candidatus Poribacteria bacterium]|nr:galactose-1-phosphate uridylyltransferase [Candidatus Poribacteria bacterium]